MLVAARRHTLQVVEDFRNLLVWRKAHRLMLDIYRVTRTFPAEERYVLTAQLRRAALAVPNNIAEGCGRKGRGRRNAELLKSARVSAGEINEVDYLLLAAHDLGYLEDRRYDELHQAVVEVRKLLSRFITGLEDCDHG